MVKNIILFVVEAMGDGVFTYIVDLANELVKSYDMYIAYATRPQTPENYKNYFDLSIHLIEVKNFTRSINPQKDLKAIPEIKKITDEVHTDIIHLHSSKAGVIGRIAFSGKDVPLFYTPHGYSFLMENYKPAKRMMFKTIETVFAKRNCTTISCSLGEHQETLKLAKKATYVNNGINTVELDRMLSKVEKIDHHFTVFTFGRICYQKNPALFNSIAEEMPDVRFFWIGDDELKGELAAPNTEITGWVDCEEALKGSYNADVFVLTGLWERLPISLLEAMYMKKFCVIDVIGNHDVIENDRNGLVCRTVDEFEKAIGETNPERMTSIAFDDIQKHYNTIVMAEEYGKIYRWVQHELVFAVFPVRSWAWNDAAAREAVAA